MLWPKAIFTSSATLTGEYGLQPKGGMANNSIPGAVPQATMKKGLRPNEVARDGITFLFD
jgi:hypothetical protein